MTDLLDPLLPIRVYIAGVNVTGYYISRSIGLTVTLGQELDTCRLALEDNDGGLGAVQGWDALVVQETGYGTTLFSGYVVSAKQQVKQGGILRWELTALDRGVLLQKIVVTETYQAQATPAILAALGADYAPWLDVSAHVAALTAPHDVRFDRVSLNECLNVLAGLDACEWWVRDDALYYVPEAEADDAPFGLADGPNANYSTTYPYLADSLEVDRDYVDVRNKVIVHGGTRASEPQTEIFTGDGVTTDFAVAHAPVNVYIAIYVAGVSQRFGREFIDDPAQYDILTNWQHGLVKFASAPAGGTEIQVIYTYDDPVRVTVTDETSVALYCPADLAYFEHIHVDGRLTTEDAAETAALNILARYAYERVYGKVTALKLGLLPGQRVQITDGTLAWAGAEYLIRSVQISEVQNKVFHTVVSFGNRQPSLLDAMLGLAGASGGVAVGGSSGQGDLLQAPKDLRQPTGYQYVTLAGGETILVPVYHQLIGTGLDFSDANNSQYIGLAL